MRAIRGAIQIESNTVEAIDSAVAEMVREITRLNHLTPERIISAIFTVTHDLDADFPARPAREQGWPDVPMICAREIPVPGGLPRVIRVLVHVHGSEEPRHVYLRGARALRPDLVDPPPPAAGAAPERP
jgi:chorismate mutase